MADSGLRGWLEGKRWAGYRPVVVLAWVVTIVLLAACVFTMVASGHTSPGFSF